ncbi:MAG: class I SAM-dependent methyltransferase [Caldilineaceae bacterium]|nr:class I SAM-dependent methyltransferase [Caldilineaceae bacterium]
MTDATTFSSPPTTDQRDLEHRYYQYLRNHQYASTDALLAVLRCYLPYFAGFQRVLDIGCGHGEFLQLLTEEGHEAVGIDIDPAMVATCRDHGLTAHEGDAIVWLQQQKEPFDAIFSSNVIEHLDAPTVQALIRSAHAALRPGGLLLIGTPNPESLIVQFHEFWRDPTHVRLYSRQLIEFFFADAGFAKIQNGNNEAAIWDGIDVMLDPRAVPATEAKELPPLEAIPPFDQVLPPLHPLPQAPAADAPFRRRLAFRVLDFVYRKFLEPYLALMRLDQERQHQQLAALQAHVVRLQKTNLILEGALRDTFAQLGGDVRNLVETRFSQVERALRFLHPSREHFVYGYKAATDESAAPKSDERNQQNAPEAPCEETEGTQQ